MIPGLKSCSIAILTYSFPLNSQKVFSKSVINLKHATPSVKQSSTPSTVIQQQHHLLQFSGNTICRNSIMTLFAIVHKQHHLPQFGNNIYRNSTIFVLTQQQHYLLYSSCNIFYQHSLPQFNKFTIGMVQRHHMAQFKISIIFCTSTTISSWDTTTM